MTWTETTLIVHVDGNHEDALTTTADLLELLISNDRVIACSAEVGDQHDDECDSYPCTCSDTP